MHYLSMWDMAELGQRINKPLRVRRDLRGYAMNAISADYGSLSLSVSDLASTICSTNRDIYLAKIRRLRRQSGERPWQAEAGTIIHTLLQDLHTYVKKQLTTDGRDLDFKSLMRRMQTYGTRRKTQLLETFRTDLRFRGGVWANLERHTANIVLFESLLVCSLLEYKASRKSDPAGAGTVISPRDEYDHMFSISAIEHALSAPKLGLSQPVTPDFLFAQRVIGDIKTGTIHEASFRLTCVAYALAYEAEYRRNIDYGVILHVDFDQQYSFPIYKGSQFFEIDDSARRQFTLVRDEKLKVMFERQEPPVQQDEPRCMPCRFHSTCWPPIRGG